MRSFFTLAAVIVLAATVSGQNQIYVPDNISSGGAACNVFPWGSTVFTYASRIPTSFLDPMNPVVDEIWFAPSASNTWSAGQMKMGIGHVPNPLPVPFTFPQINGGSVMSLGNFNDLTVIHDSDTMGPFSWTYTAATWSPLGLSALGGTGFVWNGIDDIAFYVTMSGATGTSCMYRTATEPFRVYSSGVYQSGSSSGSGNSGLKISLSLLPSTPQVPMATPIGMGCTGSSGMPLLLSTPQLPSIGNVNFALDVTQGAPGELVWLYASLGIAPTPFSFGSGCDVYLDLASLAALVTTGFSPFGPLPTGPTGAVSFLAPIPPNPGLAGGILDLQALANDAGAPNGFVMSNALELLFN